METSAGQSAGVGRGHAATRSPDSRTGCSSPVVILSWMSVRALLTHVGVYSCCPLSVPSSESVPILLRPRARRESPQVAFTLGGAWTLCGRRRRIIPRLQLIFSPRFFSGKEAGPQWQPCLTLIEWRALLFDSLWPLVTGCPWMWLQVAAEHPPIQDEPHCSHMEERAQPLWFNFVHVVFVTTGWAVHTNTRVAWQDS